MTTKKASHRLQENFICPVCKAQKAAIEILSGRTVRPILLNAIKKLAPDWNQDLSICLECLNKARAEYVEESLISELGDLNQAELDVVDAIKNQELISLDNRFLNEKLSIGDALADKIAAIGGSWTFIISFVCILIFWIVLNSSNMLKESFDPYPYILLNLVLSCLAALQAPIIMMSQNRQAAKDRLQAEADYKTNLKAELEIRHLHLKLDQLVSHQWHRLLEIQQIQIDMMNDLKKEKN